MFKQGPDFRFEISEVEITRVNCIIKNTVMKQSRRLKPERKKTTNRITISSDCFYICCKSWEVQIVGLKYAGVYVTKHISYNE